MALDSTIDMTRGVYRRLHAQGYQQGRRINSVSPLAEFWFTRLITLADDFGSFPADPQVCRALAAPRRLGLRDSEVHGWLTELAGVKLISLYSVRGTPYGQIADWVQLQPANKNGRRIKRYPGPDENDGASGGIRGNPGVSEKSTPFESESKSESIREGAPPPVNDVQDAFQAIGLADATGAPINVPVHGPAPPILRNVPCELTPQMVACACEFLGREPANISAKRWHELLDAIEATSEADVLEAIRSACTEAKRPRWLTVIERVKSNARTAGFVEHRPGGNGRGQRGITAPPNRVRSKPSAADRGEYAEPDTPLPSLGADGEFR